MNTVVQYLLNRSKMDISMVKMVPATENSYLLSVHCNVSGTGPFSSTISEMDIEMVFDGAAFGSLVMPQIKTRWGGADVEIYDRRVQISDMDRYAAFVRSVITSDETCFSLANGACTISSLGLSVPCMFTREMPIRGMSGPRASLKELSRHENTIKITVEVENSSPVEIDQGRSLFELRNAKGELVSELRGVLAIKAGTFDLSFEGTIHDHAVPTSHMKLGAIGVEDASLSWCNESMRCFEMNLALSASQLEALQPQVSSAI